MRSLRSKVIKSTSTNACIKRVILKGRPILLHTRTYKQKTAHISSQFRHCVLRSASATGFSHRSSVTTLSPSSLTWRCSTASAQPWETKESISSKIKLGFIVTWRLDATQRSSIQNQCLTSPTDLNSIRARGFGVSTSSTTGRCCSRRCSMAQCQKTHHSRILSSRPSAHLIRRWAPRFRSTSRRLRGCYDVRRTK